MVNSSCSGRASAVRSLLLMRARICRPSRSSITCGAHMRAIGRKGDVSEGSGENGSGVGQRVAEARIVAVRAGVSGCAVGAQWWS